MPARVAQRLYAPLGTRLSLGEYVRLNQRFVDLFAHKKRRLDGPGERRFFDAPVEVHVSDDDIQHIDRLAIDLKVVSLINLLMRITKTLYPRKT